MRFNSEGQVTPSAASRAKQGFHEERGVDVVEEGGAIETLRSQDAATRGQRLVRHMPGRGTAEETAGRTTDELMDLLRGE